MSDSPNPEQQLQSILKNISVGGNLTTGDISQILNLFVIVHQPNSFIPKSTPYNIPSSNTIKFVGRADALEQLHQALQKNSQVAITAIEGMGGVGKTELATQYSLLHLVLNTYSGGICWLRARDEDIGIQILRFAEAKLGIIPPEDWELKDKIDYCWSRWQEKKQGNVLIVLDDVNDYPKIQPYLPPQLSQFKVLITTRLQLDLPQSFSLDILSESASLELLKQWVGEDRVNEKLTEAKELCLRLGYLPLALNLVGRYLQKREISLAEMLVRLEGKGLQHPALDIHEKDRTRTLNIKRGVAAAFELSWEELSEDARNLGYCLGLFALAPIPWGLVEQMEIGLDDEAIEYAIIELKDLNFIQGDNTYQLHQLVKDFFQIQLNKHDDPSTFKKAFALSIGKYFEKNVIKSNVSIGTCMAANIAISAILLGDLIDQIKDKVSEEYKYLQREIQKRSFLLGASLPILISNWLLNNKLQKQMYSFGLFIRAFEVYERFLGSKHPNVIKQYKVFEAIFKLIDSSSPSLKRFPKIIDLSKKLEKILED